MGRAKSTTSTAAKRRKASATHRSPEEEIAELRREISRLRKQLEQTQPLFELHRRLADVLGL